MRFIILSAAERREDLNRTRTLARECSGARGLHALLVALPLPVRGGGWLSRTPVDCSRRVVAGARRQHHWGSLAWAWPTLLMMIRRSCRLC